MPSMSVHEGGGAFPGGVNGMVPPGLLGGSLFGDGSYSGNVIQGGVVLQPVGGVLTVTGAATVAPDLLTFSCVVMCDWLIVDGAGASLTGSTNNKGLLIFARSGIRCLNGGRIHNDKLGKAGNFGNLTPVDLVPAALLLKLPRGKLSAYAVKEEGAAGAAGKYSSSANLSGNTGSAASTMQAGGGGSGGVSTTTSGNGGKGGPCCGGAGSGGCYGAPSSAAGDYGGPGSAGVSAYNEGGGAGDPVGAGSAGADGNGLGAGGGLLMLFSPAISVASGTTISSDGAQGGPGANGRGGGGGGGGCICIITASGGYSNSGTVRTSGGAGGTSSVGAIGGAGGAGSVNIFTA